MQNLTQNLDFSPGKANFSASGSCYRMQIKSKNKFYDVLPLVEIILDASRMCVYTNKLTAASCEKI
jgi:hypothetical protein